MAKQKLTNKITAKKATKKNHKKSQATTIRNILLFLIILLLSAIVSFFSYIYINTTKESEKITHIKEQQTKTIEKKIKDIDKIEEEYRILNNKIKELKEEITQSNKSFEEETKELTIIPKVKEPKEEIKEPQVLEQYSTDYKNTPTVSYTEPKKPIIKTDKPKLAIVIDDVVFASQVKSLQSIAYPINMSFLPPTNNHPNSANIVNGLHNYMIHFPMEAMKFSQEEERTLHVGDSIDIIEKRVKELKKLYPKAKYTNNHTGSKFTSDEQSMDNFMKILKKYNIYFVDSKTTAKSVAYKYAKKYDVPFLSRDIFLDNVQEIKAIKEQLEKAIKVAKKQGYAIAIGHPYPTTVEVLKTANDILKDVEVVYIDEIPFL
ncbi:MAG: divergent polysaccharide deacetylase family protein [Arcobacter butzleri]|nr:divergent polysaccharide deacetylase family protein [Aliarcobacter butzleri]